jgi:gas vesicle protein
MESSKVLLGILGGVAAGAILGILFAPDKGVNTRKKLVDQGKDYSDNLKGKLESLKKDVNDGYNNLLADAKDMMSKETKDMLSKREV